jgi:hypothetical protein
MVARDPDAVLASLRGGDFAALVGLPECQWMDVKGGVYPLDSPLGKEELVKDVAAFANAPTGGLLIVGFSTEPRFGEEFVDALCPVPRAQVDLKRYGDVIAERVVPQPHGMTIEWFPVDDEKGVLAIAVPPQPPERTLFVIPGPTGRPRASTSSVAVPVRRNDQTIWLRPHEIQRLLAARHHRPRGNAGPPTRNSGGGCRLAVRSARCAGRDRVSFSTSRVRVPVGDGSCVACPSGR